MTRMLRGLREIGKYPSALFGLLIILALIVISIITVVAIPYDEAVRLWRGGEDVWYNSPKTASPIWFNWFREDKLPETLLINSTDEDFYKTYEGNCETRYNN